MEIAKKLVGLRKQVKNLGALNTLFADDIVSVQAVAMQGMPQESKGFANVKGKNEWWVANHEIYSASVTGLSRLARVTPTPAYNGRPLRPSAVVRCLTAAQSLLCFARRGYCFTRDRKSIL